MFTNSLTNIVSDYRLPTSAPKETTDVIPAQAGIQYVYGLILQDLLDSSFRWNDDVCGAFSCLNFIVSKLVNTYNSQLDWESP